ncbi:hypothetical protein [Streptomyces sp. NBC_01320]|uniref:hypothetical protein n=1 Tax=Streptomyces sp. NBC_01320 TaxID=2903824 RepID=UPI002E1208AC|nr:hypothetical protein OG395_05965 [Streptomyces sp. NBC_01320]
MFDTEDVGVFLGLDVGTPHQSRAQLPPASNEPPTAATVTDLQAHRIRRRPVLGGPVNEYLRAA